MPVTLTDLRELHGSVFVTELADGTIIPWRPLSIGDFIEYDRLFRSSVINHSVIENEIFCKCVTDPILVRNIGDHKAGTVTTVVSSILANSSLEDIDAFNSALEQSRLLVQQPIHQLISLVCRAFPSYKPEDVYAMDFQTLLTRIAQAEEKLLLLGGLSEPVRLYKPDEQEVQEQQPISKKKPEKDYRIDQKKIKEAFDLQDRPAPKKANFSKQVEHEELDLGSTKEGEQFVVDSNLMLMGMELGDENDARMMQKENKAIYGDYFDQMKKGGKITIKSVEERIAEAREREKHNKQRLIDAAKKRQGKK